MNKKLKILLIIIILSLPFWWGLSFLEERLENFFFSLLDDYEPNLTGFSQFENQSPLPSEIPENIIIPETRGASLNAESKINAKAAASIRVLENSQKEVLFEKNEQEILPIASLSKLMTAYIVLKYYDLSHKVEISKQAILQTGDAGQLKAGQKLSVKELLFPLLIESSNDAAYALAETIGQEKFVFLMNLEARQLGLKNTYFVNPTGLDEKRISNYSTINDLVKFTKYLLFFDKNNKDELLWNILSTKEINLYGQTLINTNQLLDRIPGIIGGRTGWTPKAGGCLLLVLQAPEGYLINIILGAPTRESRFEEMEKLISWVYK